MDEFENCFIKAGFRLPRVGGKIGEAEW